MEKILLFLSSERAYMISICLWLFAMTTTFSLCAYTALGHINDEKFINRSKITIVVLLIVLTIYDLWYFGYQFKVYF